MDAEAFFADEWPQMVPRLRATLARAGAPAADRDDLVQETAVRLLRTWPTIDPERAVEPLAKRIALNVWRDQWRHHGRREVLGDVPEQVAAADTERTAIARLHVSEVSRALATLRPGVAQTLRIAASEHDDDERRTTPAAVRMARSRARRALTACFKVASAIAAGGVIGTRWVGRPARSAVAVGAVAGVALVVAMHGPTASGAATLHFPATSAAADGVNTATPVRGTQAVRTATSAAHVRVTPHHARPEVPYYVVHAGPAGASVFIDADVQGIGVKVSRPQPGDDKPVCTYGDTPTVPTVATCSPN